MRIVKHLKLALIEIAQPEKYSNQVRILEITENHAASSSQLHLQAVWHVAKLQVHGWGQVAIKFEVLWDNVTLHKDDEESEVHARSLCSSVFSSYANTLASASGPRLRTSPPCRA